MIRPPLIVALSVFIAVTAQAQSRSSSPVQYENNDGFYIGGSWGQFDLGLSGIGDLGHGFSEAIKSQDNIWRAFGGYRFNPYAAIEASYVKFGDNPGPDEANTSSGYIPSVVLTIPDGGWELFGKLGYYLYSGASDFMYGMGFGYTFSGRFNLSFDYEVIDVPGPNTDALWFNGSFRF